MHHGFQFMITICTPPFYSWVKLILAGAYSEISLVIAAPPINFFYYNGEDKKKERDNPVPHRGGKNIKGIKDFNASLNQSLSARLVFPRFAQVSSLCQKFQTFKTDFGFFRSTQT
jgi:hypothetical protein